MTEAVCSACEHVFVVAGEVPDWWRCPDCQDAASERASEARDAAYYAGGGKWADTAREDEARRVKR